MYAKLVLSHEKSAIMIAGNVIATCGTRVWATMVSQRVFRKYEIKKDSWWKMAGDD